MKQDWIFDENDYDLDGLLKMGDVVETDFLFMIQEDELSETYYMDRYEMEKYDTNFSGFIRRVKGYLEKDEAHGLFFLFATITENQIKLFDGRSMSNDELGIGDIEIEENVFYGMMIQHENGEYFFHEAVYIRENYEKDAHAQRIHHAGELTELMEKLIFDYH